MFKIFVDGIEVKCDNQFDIEEEFMNPSSIVLTNVYPASWSVDDLLSNYYFPEDYSKCKIYKDDELYFVGIVKNSADMELNPLKPHFCSLQILDPSTLLSEGTTLDYVIANKTVTEAINQVIASISDYGFVAGNIQIPEQYDTLIGAYSTLDKAPFDVFQYLSQISLTRWGTRMVDEDTTAIDFFSPELLENQGTIELNKEYCSQNKIESITYDYSTDDYRNRQVIISDEVYGNIEQSQILIADGYNTTFSAEQKIGKINSIKVNGVEKTVATSDDKNLGITADFYYKVADSSFDSADTYSAGSEIEIKYIPIIQGREISYNSSETTRIKNNLNRNGTISRYENRTDVTSSKELQLVGQSYIKFNGMATITLTIRSRTDFLKLGGKYHFDAPIDELDKDYLVKTKKTSVKQSGEYNWFVYEYELTNSFDVENEINYFDNQRAKANGNISQGEYVSRNVDVENTANIIFSNLQITELSIDGDNTLEAGLEMPLVG